MATRPDEDLHKTTMVVEVREPEPKRPHAVMVRLSDERMATLKAFAKARNEGFSTAAWKIIDAYLAAWERQQQGSRSSA